MSKLGDALIRMFGGVTPADMERRLDGVLARYSANDVMAGISGAGSSVAGTDIAGYASVDKQLAAMAKSPWLFKAVDMIAKSVATTKLYVKRRGADAGSGDTLSDHPLVRLLEHPNPMQTASEFKTSVVRSHRLTGMAFIYVFRDGSEEPVELWPIRPDKVEIVPAADNTIAGYWVTNDFTREWLRADEVIYWHEPSPFNDYIGLSPIQSLAYTIESDAGARRYTDSFYRNQARIAGALVSENTLSKSEQDRLTNYWNENYKGAANAWKMAFLFGGLKYVPFGVSQADMQIIETLRLNKEDILTAAYGIPMGLVSENATEANAVAAYNTFATWTLYPLLVALCEKLTVGLAESYGDDIYIEAEDVRPQDKAGKLQLLAAIQQGTVGPDGMRTPIATVNEIRREWMDAPPLEDLEADMQFPEEEEEEEVFPKREEQPPIAEVPPAENAAPTEPDEDDADAKRSAMTATEQLQVWEGWALKRFRDGGQQIFYGIPYKFTDRIDPLRREVITDLLAGAQSLDDIHAAFTESDQHGEEAYP